MTIGLGYYIEICSDMNTWTDFCIALKSKKGFDFLKAQEIVEKAYEDWWKLPDAKFEPLVDWISRSLTANNIEFEIYFKMKARKTNMSGYWEIPERCRKCRNKRNDSTPKKANYKCYCLPHWGKVITNNIKCPKDMEDGGTLKSICKVNTKV